MGSLVFNPLSQIWEQSDDTNLPAGLPAVPAEAPPTPSWLITKLAFRNRFTMTEKGALYSATLTPANPTPEQLQLALSLKIYLDDLAAATFIDLRNPNTTASINTLAAIGILTPARATEILETPPVEGELYHG